MEREFLEWTDGSDNSIAPIHAAGSQKPKNYLALTKMGLELSDYLGPQLISPHVLARMEEWEAIHGR